MDGVPQLAKIIQRNFYAYFILFMATRLQAAKPTSFICLCEFYSTRKRKNKQNLVLILSVPTPGPPKERAKEMKKTTKEKKKTKRKTRRKLDAIINVSNSLKLRRRRQLPLSFLFYSLNIGIEHKQAIKSR